MSPALEKFMQSMNIGFDEWHDGIGYDLKALAEIKGEELEQVESALITRKDEDWRDAEALAALSSLGSAAATKALHDCLTSPNGQVRLRAAQHLADMGDHDAREKTIIETLRKPDLGAGVSQILLAAEEHPTEGVKQTLFWCILHAQDHVLRVNAAGLLFYLYGVSDSTFDWSFRPLFLRFGSDDMNERQAAFLELCQQVKANPEQSFPSSP